jgi:hypothetical protein
LRRREDARNLRSKKPQHKDVSTAEDRPVLHTKYKWNWKIYMEISRLKTSIDIDVVGNFNFHGLVKSEEHGRLSCSLGTYSGIPVGKSYHLPVSTFIFGQQLFANLMI